MFGVLIFDVLMHAVAWAIGDAFDEPLRQHEQARSMGVIGEDEPIRRMLREYATVDGVTYTDLRQRPGIGSDSILEIYRRGVVVTVVVSFATLEVSVSAQIDGTDLRAEEWWPYFGKPVPALVAEMASDLRRLLDGVTTRRLRVTDDGVLWWEVGGRWVQAVPASHLA